MGAGLGDVVGCDVGDCGDHVTSAFGLSTETLTVIVGSLGGLAALAAARGNRTRALFEEHRWMYEQAQARIEQLEQQIRDLRTEVDKWQRRAQGETPWPE